MDSLRTQIIALLTAPDGTSLALSAEEIAARLPVAGVLPEKRVKQIRPRLTEMAKKGLIEKIPGARIKAEGAKRSSGAWQLKGQSNG